MLTLIGAVVYPASSAIEVFSRIARNRVGKPRLETVGPLSTDDEQRLGFLDRQHPPHDRVHQAEDGGVGADPQGE